MIASIFLTWTTVVVLIVSAIWYSRRIWNADAIPVVTTFILMTVVLGLSYVMYWDKPGASWTGNPGNLSGLINVFIVTTVLTVRHVKDGTFALAFNKLQKWCLALGGLIVVGWLVTDNPTMSYLLMQTLALVAYTPTVVRLIRDKNPKDSNILWGSILLATILSIQPSLERGDVLGVIYILRALPSTLIVVGLIWWKKRRLANVLPSPVV